jgi:hypothetical protein
LLYEWQPQPPSTPAPEIHLEQEVLALQLESELQGSPHSGVAVLPAIIFFISALLSLPWIVERLIFFNCIFCFFKLKNVLGI